METNPVSQTPVGGGSATPLSVPAQTKNVYQKIQYVRAELVKLGLKKTGNNIYSKFTYYELSDFLPALNKLNNEVGLMTYFHMKPKTDATPEIAILDVINTEKPEEKIVFDSETVNVDIGKKRDGTGGADPIQNLGGKMTYMRRYLLMMAFEISEPDTVDANKQSKTQSTDLEIDEETKKKIYETKSHEELHKLCGELKNKLGPKYLKSLMDHYTARKEDFE